MFKKLLTNRNEETFIGVVLILLLIIAFYNWIIALLACIVIGGVYVLTHKTNTERNRESASFSMPFPRVSIRLRPMLSRICLSASP